MKLFISYSHDSEQHVDNVSNLVTRLRAAGVECILDQDLLTSPPAGWLQWVQDAIKDIDFILVICTHDYDRRTQGFERPDSDETMSIRHLFDLGRQPALAVPQRMIPVLLHGAEPRDVPRPLRKHPAFRLETDAEFDLFFQRLQQSAALHAELASAVTLAFPKAEAPAPARAPAPAASSQKFIARNRPPRVHIEYTPGFSPPPPAASPSAADDARVYQVWYGTNRKLVDPNDERVGYTSERDTVVHYGACDVAIPESHQIGSLGSPWWKRLLTMSDDRLRITTRWPMPLQSFMCGIGRELSRCRPGERLLLVFIHGYNVQFDAAALRAAQMGFDLKIPVTAFYSWPSSGKLEGYGADAASVEASESAITDFLIEMTKLAEAERVHIIAHSMGNRGLLRAMQRMAQRAGKATGKPFGQIILAAPDVDRDVFTDLVKAHEALADRTTLYASAKDKALAASEIVHGGYERAGFTPPVTVVPGVDTIEVSNIDLSLLGHGYYAEARDVLQDMHELLWENQPPEKRFGLKRIEPVSGQPYWSINA